MAGLGRIKCHLTVERLGEDLVEVTLLIGGYAPLRHGNSDRMHVPAEARGLDGGSPEVEEIRPFSGVFGGRNLFIGAVHDRVSTISEQSAFRNLGGVQLLSHHGLDRVSPNRNHRAKIDLQWIWHARTSFAFGAGLSTPPHVCPASPCAAVTTIPS